MNVTRITMDREQARTKLRALRKQLHRRADAEYSALAAGYEALVEGKPVISLTGAIEGGGFDAKQRPRLAIARSDRRQVMVSRNTGWRANNTIRFNSSLIARGRDPLNTMIDLVCHNAPAATAYVEGYALVPIVPAEVVALIGGGSNLRHFFTLFEVENWSDTRLRATPDRDPYLLRHLGGDLYSIIGEWDLTELERAVMLGRRDA